MNSTPSVLKFNLGPWIISTLLGLKEDLPIIWKPLKGAVIKEPDMLKRMKHISSQLPWRQLQILFCCL